MNRNQLLDKILQHLYDNPNMFWILPSWCENELQITDRNIVKSIVDELNDRDWVTHKTNSSFSVMINYNGQQIIEKYGSYSSFLKSLNNANKRTQAEKIVKIILSVIGGIGVIFGCVFTYFGYEKDKIIDKQKNEIELLKKEIDSFNKLKEKHPTTAVTRDLGKRLN